MRNRQRSIASSGGASSDVPQRRGKGHCASAKGEGGKGEETCANRRFLVIQNLKHSEVLLVGGDGHEDGQGPHGSTVVLVIVMVMGRDVSEQ